MRTRHAWALSTTVALLITACAAPQPAPAGRPDITATSAAASLPGPRDDNPRPRAELDRGGVLTLPLSAIPANLNRFHPDAALTDWRAVTEATDPGLYRYSPEGAVLPRTEFLTRLPRVERRNDRTVVIYDLNPRAVWNDGTPFDWTAFEATWAAMRAPAGSAGRPGAVDPVHAAVESVERGRRDSEVVVTLTAPTYPVESLFTHLLHPSLADPRAFDTLMKDDPHPELRSGPFVLTGVDRRSGTVTLTRNPRWWGEPALLDQVTFRQIDPSAAVPALRGGEIDAADVSNAALYRQVQGSPDLDLRTGLRASTTVLLLNGRSALLSDAAVRRAVAQAVDRRALAAVRFTGLEHGETPAGSVLFLPVQPEARDNVRLEYDPRAAAAALEAAGWTPGTDGVRTRDGERLSIRFTLHGDDPLGTALGQTVQTRLRDVGVEVVLDTRPVGAFGSTMASKDYDLLVGGGASGSPSPIGAMCQTMCSTSPGNAAGVGTPEIDARIARLPGIADPVARAEEINDVERTWLGLHGQLPLWHGPEIHAVRQGLANLGPASFAGLTPAWEDVGWERGTTPRR